MLVVWINTITCGTSAIYINMYVLRCAFSTKFALAIFKDMLMNIKDFFKPTYYII